MAPARSTIHTLGLFFSPMVGLVDWVHVGMFEREKAIYETHIDNGTFDEIHWFTYNKDDAALAATLQKNKQLHTKIVVHPKPAWLGTHKLSDMLYMFVLPLYHRNILRKLSVYKTNQMSAVIPALFAKLLYRKPLFTRSGYCWSLTAQRQNKSKLMQLIIQSIEKIAVRFSDASAVSSKLDQEHFTEQYGHQEKVHLLPNYIDTALFNDAQQQREDAIVFVGRLAPEKNLEALMDAAAQAELPLAIYGSGPLEAALKIYAKKNNYAVTFLGNCPNSQLATKLNTYKYFALTSIYEGMPKTLLEAMACGCVCIGTNVSGIREVIKDTHNGFLSEGTDANALTAAIKRATQEHKRHQTIRSAGVTTIQTHYSLTAIAAQEEEIFQAVTATVSNS